MATNEDLRPSKRPAHAGSAWLLPFLGLVAIAAALALVTLGRHAEHEAHTPARFLSDSLGEERTAPLAPVRAGNATARIDGGRLVVQGPRRDRVSLEALVGGAPGWQRHAGGEWRATPFGSEAITLGTDDPEHFLTVDRRVGRKTWEWELETKLVARLLPNGGVGFVDPVSHRVSDLTIAPVAIFDAHGDDVTPAGVRWELGQGGTLKLNLNDDDLPEPYVIDPSFRAIGAVAASAAANTVAPGVPAGVLVGDQLLAFVSVSAPTATFTVVPPAGWTAIRNERQTNVALWTFRKQATASEPATYTFTFQDPTGTNVNKTSRAVVAAYWGIQSSAPIDGSFGSNGGNNRTANVPGVSTTGTSRISIWSVGNNNTRTVTPPTINGIATTERVDSVTAAPGLEFADAAEPTAFGPITVGTGNVLSNSAFWAAQVFSLIPDTTAPTQTLIVNEGTNPGGQFYNSTTKTHYYNTAAGGTFTVGSVPVDTDSGVTSVAFNAVAQTGFTHTLVTDTTSPYASGTYTWTTANTTAPGASRVTVTDRNANALNELTITRDVTQPAAFTLNAPTGGGFISNGSTVSVAGGSPTDAGAGIADVAFRACPGANGCTWTDGDAFAVGSDTTDQYATTWPAGQSDGAYQLIARATDNVGNVRDTAAPVNVTLDNTNPTQTLALSSVSQSGGLDQAFKNGNTIYYGGGTAGSFRVRSSVSDGGSGPASATFAALGGTTTGWTFTGSTSTTPGAGTYDSNLYGWANGTTSSPTADVAPADAVGNSGAAGTLTFTNDSTAPARAFSFPAAGGSYNASGWGGSITGSASDAGADLLRVEVAIQQGSGNYYDGNSFANGSPTWLTATGTTSWSYAIAAAKLSSANVYTISLRAIDNVGNTAATITRTFTYDTAAPTFGALAVGSPANASVTGTTVYFRSGVAGSFMLSQALSDTGGSGAASVQFPAIATTGWTHGNETVNGVSPYVSSTFNWSASPSTPSGYTLTASDNAGNTATQGLTFTDDSTVPTAGALTVNGTAATGGGSMSTSDGGFVISRTDYADAGSGIATSTLTRDSAPFTDGGCGTYSGSPATLVGAPAQSVGPGCYEYVLTGTDAVGNVTSIRTVVQVHGAATQIALAGSTADLTSGATRVLTATLRDASGNTVLSDSSTVVAFAKASGAGTVSGTGNGTASNGVATKTVTGALAGPITLEATAAGLTTGTLGAFTVVHGAAAQIALNGSTADLASGATRVLTATIQDTAGNTVTSDSSTVVAFAQASGAGTVSGTGNATASSGVATKTVTGVLAGPVTMEATAAGLTTGTLGAFTVVHGAAAQIALTGSTADLSSGANRVLTATIQDAAGNTASSDSSTVIAFAKASGFGTVSGTGNATAANGVATKTVTGALAGPVTMEATAAGLTTGTLGAFSVVHGAAADIVLTGSTADLTSGATRLLTATIQDAAGNTVTSDSSTVVAFAKAAGAGTVSGTGNATASNGIATKTVTGVLAGPVTMEATAVGLATGTLGAFTVVHAAAAQIALTGSTADLISGATRVLTATIQDTAGNIVTSDSTTVVAFTKASGVGTVTGTGNATASSGVATTTITGALVGSVAVEAASTGLTTGTLGAFTIVHGAAADIVLTGSTADLTSGATRLLTATLKDAAGNTVTSDNSTVVAFAKASGAGTVSGTGNATAASGVATKTITGALAGSITMEATATGLTTGTLGTFTVVHGAATQIALAGSTADLTSGANRVLNATIQDAAGNTVTADNSTVVSFSKQSGAGTVAGTGTATASNGVATKTITGQVVGSVTMQATAGGLTTGTLGAFTVVYGSAARVALSASLSDLVSATNRILTATIQDAAGNTITSDSTTVVTFAKTSGAGTVTGTGTATAANGVATKTITGQLVGAVTMEATAVGLITGTLLPFAVVHGAAAQIELTGSTTNLTSGANRVLTAILRDAAGNVAIGDSTTVVTFAKAAGAGTVSGTGNATASGGAATKTITGALVGSVTMEASAAGLTTGTLGAFTVVHGAAAQIALTAATSDLPSGSTRLLTATVQDSAGNTIVGDNSTVVTFAQVSGAGTVTGLAGAETVSGGVATKTVSGELAGSVDLQASASGLTTGARSFDVVHGAAAKVTVSAAITDLSSGATRVVTGTVRDAAGNRVTNDNTTVITFAKTSGAGTVSGLGTDTAAAGVASKTVTGVLAGAITVEGSAPGLVADNLSFAVVHGAAAQIALTGSTADLASGATRLLTATIQDAAGNTVAADSSTVVTFTKASGAGTVTGTGDATASNGVATKTITGALVGPVTMEATAAGFTTGTLGAFTVVHGAAADILLTGSTADLTSGATRLVTATLRDAAGNTVTTDNSTVVAFAKASGAGTVSGTGSATASSGVATKTITGVLVGPVTMEATAAGLTTGTLGAFTVVHGAPAQIELTESGSTASGDNHTLTATIRDAAGNTVTADNSTIVAFAKTGGAGTVTGLGNATASSGVATKVVVNAASGQIDLDAQAAGHTTGTTSYTIVAGTASTLTSTIAASPTSIVADGSSTSAITVRLKDAAGNDLNGSGGIVALGLTGAGSLSAVTDNGDGTYSATLTSPTTVGGATVTGTLNAAALAATAAFTYTHGPATRITLAESGSTIAGSTHTLTATIEDANGNTVTSDNSTVVTFAKTGGAGTVTGLGAATAAAGVATKNVTNMLAGQIDLDAQASGLATGTTSYTVALGPVSAAASDSTVVAAPTTVYANGTDSATITVTLRDAGGNGIAGKTVTLAQGSGSSTISDDGSTNGSGAVTFSVTNATVETVTYTATDTTDAITLTDDAAVAFTFADGTPPTNTITLGTATRAWLTGTTLFYNGAAGGSFTLSSAVADGGSGAASAAYPAVAQAGWTHGAETVSTPAGGPYVSSTFTFAAGYSGSFTHNVTASDAWTPPNTSVTTLNVSEDSAAPAASILCNAAACSAGWYVNSPVSVTLAAPDAGAGLDQIRYTTDGTDPTILTGIVYGGAFDVAAEGVTTVKYRAFDRIGNDTGVQAQVVRIDTLAPDTSIDSAPATATQDPTPTFAFSSPEAGSTFAVRVDGGSWTTETSPLMLDSLAENTYTFEVRATDAAGNVDATPASFTFTVDTTPANTTITSFPPAASSSTSASFSFTASDAGPGFECSIDGGTFADCSSPTSYTGLSEAAHTFEVRAEDAAGNLDPTPATHAWTVDQTAPNTSFLSTPANPSANPTPTFGLGSTETPSTFECDLDGGGWASCSTPFTPPSLGDGSHTLKVRATDAAGNTDASEVTFTWLVDATAPTGSITSPANGADVGGTVVLASNSADAGGSGVATLLFQRSPASVGSWTSQAASWDTTAQADGDYDLRVVTTDNAGNAFTSAAITVTVDNTDPALSVVAPNPVNLATADPATVSATATDDGSGIANIRFDQCAEDSAACVSDSWVLLGIDTGAPYEASWPIPSDGPRLLRVRATDNAGKQNTELVLVTIDRIRPSGALTAPVGGANLRGAAVSLAATASDTAPGSVNTVTFQRSPAGAGTWTDVSTDSSAPFTGTLDTTGLGDGLYDLRVFTTDAAGNAEATPATIQVRVDNTAPTGAVTAPAAGANVRGTIALISDSADAGSGVATVQFQRSPAGAGTWTNQPASFDTTGVADGLYDLRVTTTDNAGNASTSATITIRVDNTAPTGAVTAPAAGANVRGTIALISDSADAGSGVATVQFQRSPAGAGTWTNQPASFDTTGVADGLYDLRVTTTDNAGNASTSATITIRVDNTLPTGSITAPLNGAEIGVPPVTLTSDSADAGGSGVATVVFERSPAGAGSWTATAANWNTSSGPDAVADGSYDLRVTTTDDAGNVFTSAVITVLVDHTAPTTTASLAPGSPSNAPVTVSFSADDGAGSGVSVISYRVDGGSLQLGAAVVVSAPGDHSNDGSHLVEFFATDEVGNVETLKSVTVVIDTTAPSGSGADPGDYLRGIANLSYSTGATDVSSVQFQFSPAGAGAWSNVGAADISPPYEAAWNTTLVADGPYDLRAVVTDTTGNVANTLLPGLPKTVDNTAPAGSVTAPAGGAYVSGSIAVDANATDGAVPPASGVSTVRFEVKPAGAGAFSVFGTQTAPVVGSTYRQTLATTALADGLAELRVVVTDVAGNETTSSLSTINVDNDAPVVTLDDPGAAVGASVNLTASSSADTADVTFRYRPVGNLGAGTAIGSDATAPFGLTWTTAPAAEQQWELIAVATDGGGNVTSSAPRVVLVDRTQPTGSVTAPASGATVGGPAVSLGATAADTPGAGVTLVEWEVKEFGGGSFTTVASDATAPYAGTWNSTTAPDGAADIRAVITDAAGNVRTTAVVPVTVDSTGPSVTLTDPGSVLSGTVSLDATTGGGAVRVQFAVSPADAGTWTQLADDTTAPFGAAFDTTTLADGLYDLRAIGFDGLGNPSAASIREDVRLDNTAPQLVSASPADGSVSTSANQIVLTASEPVTAPGALFDGAAAPAPAISGNQLTFPTGALADGLHVLSGELEDASGARVRFRVAVTIESTPSADPPPVERSITSSGDWTLTVPGGLVTVRMPQSAWPTPPTPQDYILVLRVDAGPVGSGFAPGTQIVDVTARWALAGTYVTEFNAPIEIIFSNPSGTPAIPGHSPDASTWRTIAPISGPLGASQRDGFTRSGSDVHVWTRHLTYFGLLLDDGAPTAPRDLAGVVRDDGLTLRWIPGTDASGQLGNLLLFVNGEPYREFGPTEFEAKLGAFSAGDTRSFTLVQKDAAGNASAHTAPLRAVPALAGKSLDAARATLGAAGFTIGDVRETTATNAPAGTVVEPAGMTLALVSSPVDLVLSRGTAAPQTRLALAVAGSKKLELKRMTTVAVRIKVSRPAQVTATLRDAKNRRLHTWKLQAKAGANVVRLRLPAKVRRPGAHRLTWIARSGTETVSRTTTLKLVGPAAAPAKPKPGEVEIVLAGKTPPGEGLEPGKQGMPRRVSSAADADHTFDLIASTSYDVDVVVVDADAFGTRFITDLRAVFPKVRVIAISREPARRVLAVRAGATLALPRTTTARQLARAIALVAGR